LWFWGDLLLPKDKILLLKGKKDLCDLLLPKDKTLLLKERKDLCDLLLPKDKTSVPKEGRIWENSCLKQHNKIGEWRIIYSYI
jgi:hypothetical protein